jgi:hypothetical protein
MDTPAQASDPVCLDLGTQTLVVVLAEIRVHLVIRVVVAVAVEPHISASKAVTLL